MELPHTAFFHVWKEREVQKASIGGMQPQECGGRANLSVIVEGCILVTRSWT